MLKQIRYFQSVVEEDSFTKAADSRFISQSAISQQTRNLGAELGVTLLTCENHGFGLTKARRYFYERSLALVADFDALCQGTQVVVSQQATQLPVGYLYPYEGNEIQKTIVSLASQFPDVALVVKTGAHSQLYDDLHSGKIDLVINDQRHALSTDYENSVSANLPSYVAFAAFNPHTKEKVLAIENSPDKLSISVVGSQQKEIECAYYRDYIDFSGDIRFVPNATRAKMPVAANRGYLPFEFRKETSLPLMLSRHPIYKQGKPTLCRMCVSWEENNSGYYVETMAELLVKTFQ